MKIIAVLLLACSLGGCVAMGVAAGVGAGVAAHRDWCWRHYRNPHCIREFPMGVHR